MPSPLHTLPRSVIDWGSYVEYSAPSKVPALPEELPAGSIMVWNVFLSRYIPVDSTGRPIRVKDRDQIRKGKAASRKAIGEIRRRRLWNSPPSPSSRRRSFTSKKKSTRRATRRATV